MKTLTGYFSRRILSPSKTREAGIVLKMIRGNKVSMVGLIVTALFVAMGVLAPWITPSPEEAWGRVIFMDRRFEFPSLAHPFGTDELGRDLFSRVILGSRFSLIIGVSVVTLAFAVGVPVGLAAGYVGGRLASVLMRVTDMFLAFPPILIAIALVMVLGRGLENVILSLTVSWWPWYARLGYVQANQIKKLPFIEAAKSVGVSKSSIIFRHVLPNTLTPMIVQAALDLGSAVLEAAALSFLGLGVQPPTPEWGLLASEGWTYVNKAWWITGFAGFALFVVVLGFNLLGDALRESMDPRLRVITAR